MQTSPGAALPRLRTSCRTSRLPAAPDPRCRRRRKSAPVPARCRRSGADRPTAAAPSCVGVQTANWMRRRSSRGGTSISRVDNGEGIAPPVARLPMLASPGGMPRPLCCAGIRHRSTYFDEIVQLSDVFAERRTAKGLCRSAALGVGPSSRLGIADEVVHTSAATPARPSRPFWTPGGSRGGNAHAQPPRIGEIRQLCPVTAAIAGPAWHRKRSLGCFWPCAAAARATPPT
jgi:hypothetical protein